MNDHAREPFVHLHVHSEYSLLDGAATIDGLVEAAARQGMKALALTDHGVMYGAIAFYKACRKHGIKPIIGCEVYYTASSRFEMGNRKDNPIYHLILLAQNAQGYRNLMKIVSIAQLEGMHYKPRVDAQTLQLYQEGIICLSACLGGEINQHLLQNRYEEAKAAALRYYEIFGDRFYLELQDHGLLEQKRAIKDMLRLSKELHLPVVATNDVHYIKQEEASLQEVLICIGTGKTMQDQDRLKMETDQLYLKTTEEMTALFQHVPEAISNTWAIANRCELIITLDRVQLPQFWPLPDQETSAGYLQKLCQDGLLLRYANSDKWMNDVNYRKELQQRLQYELEVIERMGFSDYFLIVWDFIRFARERQIRVGPGRGSSAGSLVAYTLYITDVDPIKYKLLFERFLNPERITMPDIDIDFDDERRDEVIHYVSAKYGEEHVAQIITFGTLAAKAAIRDVGRVLNISYQETDRAAKLIPSQLGITISSALAQVNQLQQQYDQSAATKMLLDMAMAIEGRPRHASTHAAGVVISAEPLTNFTPLQAGSESLALTQYSMEHLEAVGLLKMDFLGLRTLSILERSHRWVKQLYGREVDFTAISDLDEKTYKMLGQGETTGVFQLESAGVRKVLKELKPTEFEDIVSVLALYRPGPMEFIPKYIDGKHGNIHVEYPHDSLRQILQDTYGIIVYQEQIMQIASTMAGFSLGEADLLRRAVSKKKREVLDEERAHFVRGSLQQGYTEQTAHEVYDMIVRFADYGFNRAHAVAYGVLSFQTAWFKAHYPTVFLASMLASVTGNMNKTAEYVEECGRMGIAVLPPCINESSYYFMPLEKGIRFGLSAIKNVGTQAIDAIIKAREEGMFTSLLEFCKRVDLRVVNKRVLESLILAGAMDQLPGHRAQLFAVLDEVLDTVGKWKKQREELQIELFGFEEVQNWDIEMPDIRPFTLQEQLDHEYELLGMYLSGHPLDELTKAYEADQLSTLTECYELPDHTKVVLALRVASLRPYTSKAGQAMAFAELEDRFVRIEAVMFNKVWRKLNGKLQKDQLIFALASIQRQDEGFKLLIEEVIIYDETQTAAIQKNVERLVIQAKRLNNHRAEPYQERNANASQNKAIDSPTKVFIKINAEKEQTSVLHQLNQLLLRYAGNEAVVLYYASNNKAVSLSEKYRVKASKAFIQDVESLLGVGSIVVK